MKFKVGMVVWSYRVFEGKVDCQEWVCRSIRRPKKEWWHREPPKQRAHFIEKIKDVTWVRKSKKVGDYGWATKIDYWLRRSIAIDEHVKSIGMYTTKLQAARAALKEAEEDLKKGYKYQRDGYRDWPQSEVDALVCEYKRNVTVARRNLTKVENARRI